jgi:hypothetical protein
MQSRCLVVLLFWFRLASLLRACGGGKYMICEPDDTAMTMKHGPAFQALLAKLMRGGRRFWLITFSGRHNNLPFFNIDGNLQVDINVHTIDCLNILISLCPVMTSLVASSTCRSLSEV